MDAYIIALGSIGNYKWHLDHLGLTEYEGILGLLSKPTGELDTFLASYGPHEKVSRFCSLVVGERSFVLDGHAFYLGSWTLRSRVLSPWKWFTADVPC